MDKNKITEFLNDNGIICRYHSTQKAPKYTFYYFTITDYKRFTPALVKAVLYRLSAADGKQYYQAEKTPQGANIGFFCADDNYSVSLDNIAKCDRNKMEFSVGIDHTGETVKLSSYNMVHALIAGTTGSGKSVFLKSMIYQLSANNRYYNYYIIDKKQSLTYLSGLPQCKGFAVDDNGAILALQRARAEMYERFDKLKIIGADKGNNYFPPLIIYIDELADLMYSSRKNEIKELLISIAQLGRAACIHLVLCTQSPRVQVIDGMLLANIPTRISFKTASARESVLIFGHKGAEVLLGNGDGLIKLPDKVNEIHFQAPFVDDDTIKKEIQEL